MKQDINERMKAYRHRVINEKEKRKKIFCWPSCIGKFPECKEYNIDMKDEEKLECKKCPYGKI